MANHPHIGFRNAQKTGDIRARLLVVESHDDDGPFAFFQILHTARELFMVKVRDKGLDRRRQIRAKLFEKAFLSLSASALVEYRHTARSQHERYKLFRIPQAARPQGFEGSDQNLLGEIVRGLLISQVAESVETDARSHAPEKFGFRVASVAGADAPHQVGVV